MLQIESQKCVGSEQRQETNNKENWEINIMSSYEVLKTILSVWVLVSSWDSNAAILIYVWEALFRKKSINKSLWVFCQQENIVYIIFKAHIYFWLDWFHTTYRGALRYFRKRCTLHTVLTFPREVHGSITHSQPNDSARPMLGSVEETCPGCCHGWKQNWCRLLWQTMQMLENRHNSLPLKKFLWILLWKTCNPRYLKEAISIKKKKRESKE